MPTQPDTTDSERAQIAPGQWDAQADLNADDWSVYAEEAPAGAKYVAECWGPFAEGNARLIAEAPELLRVCKLALASWFSGEVSEIHMETELRAVIARVEGKS